jgi:hypothetical protein
MHDAKATSAITAKAIRIFFLFIYINSYIIRSKNPSSSGAHGGTPLQLLTPNFSLDPERGAFIAKRRKNS